MQDGVHLLGQDTLNMVEAHGVKVLDTRYVNKQHKTMPVVMEYTAGLGRDGIYLF